MQIVIPMSGYGERFRQAGYTVPKPLIAVEGKRMIEHVVDLFPGETDLVFVCNETHLADPGYRLREILEAACPTGRIIGIPEHKLGPVHAVLSVEKALDPDREVVVNYCDFSQYWSWSDFRQFVRDTDAAGALPAYRGFHPHSLRGGVYAFIREDGLWAQDIQEKQPFTSEPMTEFASSGTYYFRSARLMLDAMRGCMERGLDVRGEYYVSMVYKLLFAASEPVAVYELQHFMQWGTPADLADYENYSRIFRGLVGTDAPVRQQGSVMIPAVGAGRRYAEEGYEVPKPLVPVSGRPMILQAASDLPSANRTIFVLRRDQAGADRVGSAVAGSRPGAQVVWLDRLTDGQARTCREALSAADPEAMLTIAACDNGLLYPAERLTALFADPSWDLLVWGFRGHPEARRRPEMFGWIDADATGRVRGVSVKRALPNGRPESDPIVVGTFTFRRAGDFLPAFERLEARDGRVNGELYVDSMIEDAIALGWRVRLFDIDGYPGWGTPDDLRVFEYWQSCFHKWSASPYRLEQDRHVPSDAVAGLAQRYAPRRPPRPATRHD